MQEKTTQVPSQPTESQIRISDRQKERGERRKAKKHAGKLGNKGRMPVAVNRTCRELQTSNKTERLEDAIQYSRQHCSKTQGEASRCRN